MSNMNSLLRQQTQVPITMTNTYLQKIMKKKKSKSQSSHSKNVQTWPIKSKYRLKMRSKRKEIVLSKHKLAIRSKSKKQELQLLMEKNANLKSVPLNVTDIAQLLKEEKSVLKSTKHQRLLSSLRFCVLDVVSVLRNVLSKQSTLSTCLQDLRVKWLIDMATISLRSTDYQHQSLEKFSD